MNKRFYILSLIAALLLKSSIIFAQESALILNSSYTGDYFQNLTGGYRNGGGYLGYAKIGLGFDTENIGLWKGGSFYIGGGNTHGASPSLDYIGDFQAIDNIEVGDHTFLEKLWFQQKLGKFIIRLGLQDLNDNFAACETASEYILQNERRSLTPFIQTAFTINEMDNDNYFHAGAGINLKGVLSKKQRDIIEVASSMFY